MRPHLAISPARIGSSMTTNDKLAHHTRNAKHQHTSYIYQNEGGTTVLSGHIRETPHVAQSYSRACRGENHTQFASKVYSFL